MSTQRDPRRDPRPGDKIETLYFRRQVLSRSGDIVTFKESLVGSDAVFDTTWRFITEWRDCARNATVIHTATESDT